MDSTKVEVNKADHEYMKLVLERHYQETVRENKIHSLHSKGWLENGLPYTDCPCKNCYLYRRDK